MPIRECPQCGNGYDQDAPWKSVCITCFKINKRREEVAEREFRDMVRRQQDIWENKSGAGPTATSADVEVMALQRENNRLKDKLQALTRRTIRYEEQYTDLKYKHRQVELALEQERRKRHEPPPFTLRDLSVSIKDLIKLTHPDRHGGDPLANRVTGELITAMKRARA